MKKHLKKRILALWLSVCMVLSMMPSMALPVFAAVNLADKGISSITVGDTPVNITGDQAGDQLSTAIAGSVSIEASKKDTAKLVVTLSEAAETGTVKYLVQTSQPDNEAALINEATKGEDNKVFTATKIENLQDGENHLWIEVTKTEGAKVYFDITVTVESASVANPTVTGETDLQVGNEGGTITLTVESGSFKTESESTYFTLSEESLNVSNVVATTKTATLTVTGTPENPGELTVTINKDAFNPAASKEVTATVNVKAKDVIVTAEEAIPVDDQNPTVTLHSTVNFASSPNKDLFKISGVDGLQVSGVEASNTEATLSFTGTAKQAGTLTLTIDKTAFETTAPNNPIVEISVKNRTEIPTFSAPTTVTATDGNTKAAFTVFNKDAFASGGKVTVAVYKGDAYDEVDGTINGEYAEDTLTLTFTEAITAETKLKVTFQQGENLPSDPSQELIVNPAVAKLDTLQVNDQSVSVSEAGSSESGSATALTAELTKYAESFTITATFGGSAKYGDDASSVKESGTELRSGDASETIRFSGQEPKVVYIYVENAGVEGYYKLTVTNGTPTATLTARLNNGPLKKDVAITNQTITLTLDGESTAKFKTDGLQGSDFQLGGDGSSEISITNATSENGTTATLTLSGTPKTAGPVTVTAQTSAFNPVPAAVVEATGDINVIDAEKTSTPVFASTTVNCEKGNTKAIFTVTNPSAFEGDVTVEVKKDAGTVEGLTGVYNKEDHTLTLTFPTALTEDNNQYTVTFTDGGKEPSGEVTLTVNRYVPDAPKFESDEATFATADATAVTYTLTNGPAGSYKLYTEESAGDTASDVTSKLEGSILTLTYTEQPKDAKIYYVAAVDDNVESTTRTKITVNPYTAPPVSVTGTTTLKAGTAGGTITLTAENATFSKEAAAGNFTLGDELLTVSSVVVSEDGKTATLTITGTPAESGELTVTVAKEALDPETEGITVNVTIAAAVDTATPKAVDEVYDITAEDGNKTAVLPVTNEYTAEGIQVTVYNAEGTAVAEGVTGSYADGEITLTFEPALSAATTYRISVTEAGKNESGKVSVKVLLHPVTADPEFRAENNTVTAEADNKSANFVVENADDYTGEVKVTVYNSEGTETAEGVEGSYTDGILTLTFEPALTEDTTSYQVTFQDGTDTVSGKVKVTVEKFVARTPDPVPAVEGIVTVACNTKANTSAQIELTNWQDYGEGVEVKVYDADGKDANVTATYDAEKHVITLTAKSDTLPGTYQVTMTNEGQGESGKLQVVVTEYKAAADAELSDFTGTASGTTYIPVLHGEETGDSVSDAIFYEFNVDSDANITSVSFTAPTTATVTYLASEQQLTADDLFTEAQSTNNEKGTITIDGLDFSTNHYLYIKSVSEDESVTRYYVIAVNKIEIEAGKAETKTDIPEDYATALGSLENTALGEESEAAANSAILDAIAANSKVMNDIENPGDDQSPAGDGTVWGRLKNDNPAADGTLTFFYIPEISVTVADGGYDAGAKKLTVDITPTYSVIATTASSLNDAKFKDDSGIEIKDINAVVVAENQPLNLQNVEVTIPIPETIAKDGETVYVQHDGSWGAYEVTSNSVTLTVPHFSEFVITAEAQGAAIIGTTVYDSVQDAIDAVKEGETITLTDQVSKADLKNLTPPTSGVESFTIDPGESGITLSSGDVTFIRDALGDGYIYNATATVEGEKAVVNVFWKKVYHITVTTTGTGSMTADKPAAKTGDTVTLTVGSGTLDSVTVKTKSGKDVTVAPNKGGESTYTFTMPDEDVTVTAAFTKSGSNLPGGSGSGSSGTVTPATVNSSSTINGSFTVSDKNAKAGDTVTVTPKADEGYVVDQVTVTDKSGKAVEVKDNGDGTYSFVMPEAAAQPVTVGVTFKAAAAENTLVFTNKAQERDIVSRFTNSKDTTLKLKAADEGVDIGSLADWSVESDNTEVVQVLKPSNKLHYVGVGTANVKVTAKGDNGKEYSLVITINVKLGVPTFTLSHVSSKKARTFTVTTSTVRDADGFQVQYSLKKSLKSSKSPKYEAGKKLIRKTITTNKSKRTYYVRVRAYKLVDGKYVYGDWSKLTKTVKSR